MKQLCCTALLLAACIISTARAACTANLLGASATGLGFGNYRASSASDTTATATITANCTLGGSLPSFTIALSTGGSGSYSQRRMSLLSTLNYNIYTSGSYSAIWGDGTSSTSIVSYGGGGTTQNFTVYGVIPTHQYVPAGIYLDTIIATITY